MQPRDDETEGAGTAMGQEGRSRRDHPDHAGPTTHAAPPLAVAFRRGLAARCPVCGSAPLFRSALSVVRSCAACGATLADVPADDAPPYITILLAAHPAILLGLVLVRDTALGTTAVLLVTLPIAVLLCLLLLRPVKGALVGILVALEIGRDDASPTDRDRSVHRDAGGWRDLTDRTTMPSTSSEARTKRGGSDGS